MKRIQPVIFMYCFSSYSIQRNITKIEDFHFIQFYLLSNELYLSSIDLLINKVTVDNDLTTSRFRLQFSLDK